MARFLALGGFIIAVITAGCSGAAIPVANTASPTTKPIPILSPAPTIPLTDTPGAQITPTIPSIIKVPPFDTPDMQLNSQCNPLKTGVMASDPTGGAFLYLNSKHQPALLDFSSGKGAPFIPSGKTETAYGGFAISPDGKWVAYSRSSTSGDEHQIVVAPADGTQEKTFAWTPGWVSIARWINNTSLAIRKRSLSTPAFDILNPFSGKFTPLFTDFPGIYPLEPFPNWDRLGETAYDPTLRYVTILHMTDDTTVNVELLFQDVHTQQVLARIYPIFSDIDVSWAQDGSFFVYPNSYWDRKLFPDWYKNLSTDDFDLYRVDRDGKVTQLTDLMKTYSSVSIGEFSIAPNEKRIAFWLTIDPLKGGDPTLAVLDLETHVVTVTCISSQDGYLAPIWDLDSSLIALKGYAKDAQVGSDLIFVRIPDGEAVDLGKDMDPVGWLAGDH